MDAARAELEVESATRSGPPEAPSRGAARARRVRIRRARRALGAVVLLGPALWMLGQDLWRRHRAIFDFDLAHAAGYWGSLAASAIFWGLLVHAASYGRGRLRHVGAALLGLLFVCCVGVQSAFYSLYRIYLSIDGQIFSDSAPWAIVGTLPLRQPGVLIHLALSALGAAALVAAGRKLVRPRPLRGWIRALLVAPPIVTVLSAGGIPVSFRSYQSTTPDFIYLNGFVGRMAYWLAPREPGDTILVRVQRRTPEPLPPLSPKPARRRNVLLILQEAERADAVCVAYDPDCKEGNVASNKLAPSRLPLLQMRSNASSTAIAISNLWSGVDPTESKERLHSAPLVWEYAHAAGYDTAYWTSQNLMFGNARLYVQDLPLTRSCSGTTLDPQCDWLVGADDDLLSDRVVEDWGALREPFFAVVHYSNIHHPRLYDPEDAPFQPSDPHARAKSPAFRNYYKNVVYLSDLAVAKLLRHVRSTESGKRTVVLYTSDHGEAFMEHNNENYHSPTVYDEEIRVPAWIDAPPGTLSPDEERAIRKARTEFLWQIDLPPTMLDLMGIWDDPAIAKHRARMIGHPITRPARTTEPVPLTNVSWVWEYYLPNWGMMQGPLKLFAGPHDTRYQCFDLRADPFEKNDLGEEACAPLVARARAHYRMMPADMKHLAGSPGWAAR